MSSLLYTSPLTIISSIFSILPDKKFVTPAVLLLLTCPLRVPLRISISTSTTFLSVSAKLIAKLVDTNVLPESGLKEVNRITCFPTLSNCIKSILVRIIRKASDIASLPFSLTTISLLSFLSLKGTSPKNGIVVASSTSFLPRTVVFSTFISQITKAGMAHPANMAIINTLIFLGAIGLVGPVALSITLALLSVIACVSAFSSLLFNK